MYSFTKRFLLAFVSLAAAFTCPTRPIFAQSWHFDVKGAVQLPMIRDLESGGVKTLSAATGYITSTIQYRVKENYSTSPGGAFQITAERRNGSGFYAGAGLGMQLLRYRRTITTVIPGSSSGIQPSITGVPYSFFYSRDTLNDSTLIRFTDPGTSLQAPADAGKTRCLRLEVPVFAGYRFLKDRAGVGIGINTSILAWSEQYLAVYNPALHTTELTRNLDSEGLTPVLFSVTIEAAYRWFSNCSLYARYSLPLSPLYEQRYQYAGRTGCQILEAGLACRIAGQENKINTPHP